MITFRFMCEQCKKPESIDNIDEFDDHLSIGKNRKKDKQSRIMVICKSCLAIKNKKGSKDEIEGSNTILAKRA